jgi:hypothetical protein
MPAVGDPILAEDLLFARLTSNFNLATSSTTLQNVTGLSVSVPANSVYVVEAVLLGINAAGTTEDIQYGFAYPSGGSLRAGAIGGTTAGVSGESATDVQLLGITMTSGSTTLRFGLSTTATTARINGVLSVGSTAGTFQLQAAQNTSGANVCTIQAQSYILLIRVG